MILHHTFATELTELGSYVKPVSLKTPQLQAVNHDLLNSLELPQAWLNEANLFKELFTESGKLAEHAMAQKYGGHQFGHWNPELGDGRGLLLGNVTDSQQQKWDLHLKGAGPTPYSRFADGRAVLRSTIREYLASEALHYLGIPSSRALCLISSEEPVLREVQETAAMMIRVCPSHIRFGHFEYFYHSNQKQKLQALFDYCFKHHFQSCVDTANPYLALLEKITTDTAQLIAKWQAYGFNHGVMNTDNMSIHGITFDYGPYAFLDDFEPTYICNHSDPQGRYSFDSQPGIGLWNLNALAQSFTDHLDIEQIKQVLGQYEATLIAEYSRLMLDKCGLIKVKPDISTNVDLVNGWLALLSSEKKDFTYSFRLLCDFTIQGSNNNLRDTFVDREKFDQWANSYAQALTMQAVPEAQRQHKMKAVNPKVILRNHIVQETIEHAEQGDFTHFHELLKAIKTPFSVSSTDEKFCKPPPESAKHIEISCSS